MNAHPFTTGQVVWVRKYGRDYRAVVTIVTRSRITVKFTTLGGKVKEQQLSADDTLALVSVR